MRAFLARILPRRFSVGTGFLVCSNPAVPASHQIDTVVFDEIYNSPLHRELAAYVFPIEMVYGTVEVKGLLRARKSERKSPHRPVSREMVDSSAESV